MRTQEQEFDYPGKSGDVYREYTGEGGIPISPLLSRLAFSARFGKIKFFTTSSLGADSRIIIRNNISERIGAAAPFLTLDADPYMVIADGRLWWIQDAYTTTSRYPYAAPEGEFNYIRNSVKIVIDAYNGSMTFYAFDEEDPLLRAYRAAFPGLFTPLAEMPKALMEHVRYPEGLFGIQASVYSTYHVDEPDVLYNKGDQWAIPERRLAGRAGEPHAGLLRHHAAAGRGEGGVPADAPLRAQRAQQHDQLAGRPLRPAQLRQVRQLPVLQEHHRRRPRPGGGSPSTRTRRSPRSAPCGTSRAPK